MNQRKIRRNAIKIKQYSLDGKLIKTWDSISLASQCYNIPVSSISGCCKGYKGRKTTNGYVWRYINDPFEKYSLKNDKYSPVCQFDLNGTYINRFETIANATKIVGISSNNISMCCSNYIKSAGGYIWKYIEENKYE